MPFKNLPTELLDIIVQYLGDEHPPSVLNLAFVNKSCLASCLPVAKSLLLGDITISLGPAGVPGSDEKLNEKVQTLVRLLEHTSSFARVRRLIIIDEDELCNIKEEWPTMKLSNLRLEARRPRNRRLRSPPQIPWPKNRSDSLRRLHDEEGGLERAYIREGIWKPVVELIQRLPVLTDLIYRCNYDQFPPCLLQTLHLDRPRCRLHLQSFRLYSLEEPTTDSREFELVTSPSLHSVMLRCLEMDESWFEGSPCRQEDALLRVLKLAPNLKNVNLEHQCSTYVRDSFLLDEWKGFSQEDKGIRRPMASLNSLQLLKNLRFEQITMHEWSQHTDFSVLENLELLAPGPDAVHDHWNITKFSFPSLKSLAMQLADPWEFPGDYFGPEDKFFEMAQKFLESLPPLSSIGLWRWRSLFSLEPLARIHGPRLRRLEIWPTAGYHMTTDDILQIGKNCPFLETMLMTIQRSQSDSRETALYKALGSIRRLKSLALTLDVCPPDLRRERIMRTNSLMRPEIPPDPSFSDFENEFYQEKLWGFLKVRKGHVRNLIINCLLDKSLACGIFRAISAAKPDGSSPLELVNIVIQCDPGLALPGRRLDYQWIRDLFCSVWSVQRDPRDTHHEELITHEYWIRSLGASEKKKPLDPCIEAIFRNIWPEKDLTAQSEMDGEKEDEEKKNSKTPSAWWQDCHSFPLATDS